MNTYVPDSHGCTKCNETFTFRADRDRHEDRAHEKSAEHLPVERFRVCDLKLGDVVKLSDGAYMFATVTEVLPGASGVRVFRPYVHRSDFAHSGGLTCYVGIEHFTIVGTVTLVERVREGGIR